MTERSISEWLDELAAFLNDAAGAHGFAAGGLLCLLQRIQETQRASTPDNPDPKVYFGVGDPNTHPQPYQVWRIADLSQHLAHDGPVITQIGQQWVVQVYTAWEEYFRPGLATTLQCEPNDLKYPVLGDLRRWRNDVVHHRGIATRAETGRCEALRWFVPGDTILIRGQQVAEFMQRFPWTELRAGPPVAKSPA